MTCATRGQAMAAGFFGIAGVLLSAQYDLEKHGRDQIVGIVTKAFTQELAQARVFPVKPSNADAVMQLELGNYGLISNSGFNSKLRPILTLKAKLITANGKTVFEASSTINDSTDPRYIRLVDEYKANPALLTEALTAVAKKASAEIVSKLRQ